MRKGEPIAKATTRREVRNVMVDAGLPDEARNAGQLASMIANLDGLNLVVATVSLDKTATMTFGGYYPADEAEAVAQAARRKRKVQVTSAIVVKQPTLY